MAGAGLDGKASMTARQTLKNAAGQVRVMKRGWGQDLAKAMLCALYVVGCTTPDTRTA